MLDVPPVQTFAAEWYLPPPAKICGGVGGGRGCDDQAACVFSGCLPELRRLMRWNQPSYTSTNEAPVCLLTSLIRQQHDRQVVTFGAKVLPAAMVGSGLFISQRAVNELVEVAPVVLAKPSLEPYLRRRRQLSASPQRCRAAAITVTTFFCRFH